MFRKVTLFFTIFVGLWALAVVQAPLAWADGTPTPEANHGHAEGTPEADHHEAEDMPMADEHEHGERIDANGAAIKIISPADGATMSENSAIVRVETTNWPLGEGKHFHLYVNGQEQGMSQGTSHALQAHDLKAGENQLEVVLSNDLHQELNATHAITVKYEADHNAAVETATSSNGALLLIAGVAAAVVVVGSATVMLTRKK